MDILGEGLNYASTRDITVEQDTENCEKGGMIMHGRLRTSCGRGHVTRKDGKDDAWQEATCMRKIIYLANDSSEVL